MMMTESSLERSLSLLREQGLRALDLRSSDAYRRVLFSHIDFLELYLRARTKFIRGVRTSRVTGPAFLGYESNVLYKIAASVEELVRKAMQCRDSRITGVTGYGLTQALTRTIDLDAYPVFVKVLELVKISLILAMNIEDISKRKQTIEILASAIENFSSYNLVVTHLDEAPERLESLPNYGQALIGSLSGILKESIDRADTKIFSVVFSTLTAMFQEGPRDPGSDLYILEMRLERGQFSNSDRLEAEVQVHRLREEIEFFRSVRAARTELIYNLGGWATKRYDEKKLVPDHAQAFMSRIFPYFSDFTYLTKLHLKSLTQDSDSYGWGLLDAGPGAFAPSQSWLRQFYVVAALRILARAPTRQDRDGVYRAVQNQTIQSSSLELAAKEIREVSDAISANFPKWRILLPDLGGQTAFAEGQDIEQGNRFDILNNFWDELVSLRRYDEEQRLLNVGISEDTRAQFAAELRKSWSEYSTFKKLAKAYGFFEDHMHDEDVPDEVQPWGLSRLEDKMWYVAENQFAFKSIAETVGRGLGESETTHGFETIAALLDSVAADEPHQAQAILDAFIDSVPNEKLDLYVLLSSRGFDFAAKLYDSINFQNVRASQSELAGINILAKYRGIPIIEVWGIRVVTGPCGICVPIRELGVWRQYWAGARGEEMKVELESIDVEKAELLLQQQARLGHDTQGQPLNHTEAVLRLRKRVLVRISERFEYAPRRGQPGIKIVMPTAP